MDLVGSRQISRCEASSFTCGIHKERAGNKRGGWYWKAYRTQHSKHSSLYLGKSEALTLDRLHAVAQTLAQASIEDATGEDNTNMTSLSTEQVKRPFSTPTPDLLLLATKFHMPRLRAPLVHRPHLVERLQQAVKRPLTLIAAPAGFGKTTLLSTWLEHGSLQAAWITLDPDDDDLTRFWSYVFTALSRVHPGSGTSALALLQASTLSPLPPIETVLSVWINELATLPHEVALVLDDYHLITAQPIHRAITYLLDHLPPQLHLVIATRADPPLSLARLRARGHLTEIRAVDLRFTTEETAAFLTRTLSLNLSGEDIAALETRTEGWIAGLQLAALSMQGQKDATSFIQSFTGSHHFVLDYLLEEVLQRQSDSVQTFLLRTSILDHLCGPLCDAVLRGPTASAQATLEYLERANLFLVPLDSERCWYRYHHLFADLLRQRLHHSNTSSTGDEAELHRRASQWYEDHGLEIEAFHHAAAANDVERAARLIEGQGVPLHFRGAGAPVLNWLESLPR